MSEPSGGSGDGLAVDVEDMAERTPFSVDAIRAMNGPQRLALERVLIGPVYPDDEPTADDVDRRRGGERA